MSKQMGIAKKSAKRITTKQRVARVKNIEVARRHRKKVTGKISISKAFKMLASKGYKLDPTKGGFNFKTKKTSYGITSPSGKTKIMNASDIVKLINKF